jgi:hypothetical protein
MTNPRFDNATQFCPGLKRPGSEQLTQHTSAYQRPLPCCQKLYPDVINRISATSTDAQCTPPDETPNTPQTPTTISTCNSTAKSNLFGASDDTLATLRKQNEEQPGPFWRLHRLGLYLHFFRPQATTNDGTSAIKLIHIHTSITSSLLRRTRWRLPQP